MTPTQRKAMEQALEVLEQLQGGCTDSDDGTVEVITVWCPEVIDTLRTALAEQPAIPPGYKPERPLTDEMALTLAKFAGMKFSPAQFSGVLECETDEFTLATFARLVLGFAAAPEAPQPARSKPQGEQT